MIARIVLALALAVITTSVVSAQNVGGRFSGPINAGITVSGRGAAASAPDRARIAVQIFNSAGPPVPSGTAPAVSVPFDTAANALRDALHASGVADARIVFPIGTLSARIDPPAVIGTIAKPTRERLEKLARDVIKALPDRVAPAFANARILVALLTDDCTVEEGEAERAAYSDARKTAQRIASVAGVRLGAVLAINDAQTYLPPGCGTKPDTLDSQQNNFAFQANLYAPLELPITVNETVTFAIAGS